MANCVDYAIYVEGVYLKIGVDTAKSLSILCDVLSKDISTMKIDAISKLYTLGEKVCNDLRTKSVVMSYLTDECIDARLDMKLSENFREPAMSVDAIIAYSLDYMDYLRKFVREGKFSSLSRQFVGICVEIRRESHMSVVKEIKLHIDILRIGMCRVKNRGVSTAIVPIGLYTDV